RSAMTSSSPNEAGLVYAYASTIFTPAPWFEKVPVAPPAAYVEAASPAAATVIEMTLDMEPPSRVPPRSGEGSPPLLRLLTPGPGTRGPPSPRGRGRGTRRGRSG